MLETTRSKRKCENNGINWAMDEIYHIFSWVNMCVCVCVSVGMGANERVCFRLKKVTITQ